jgi:prepilin-type N-terminal cleavage/methylation domain-containing protein
VASSQFSSGVLPRARHQGRRPGNAGMTVIEVAVALSVLSIGLLGLAAVIPLAKTDLRQSSQRTQAVFLAQESAEWLRGLAYDDSLLTAGDYPEAPFGVDNYVRSWTVENNVPVTGVKRVTVQVRRTAGGSETAQIVLLHAEAGR